ncbi:MAG: alpha/beta hydrolase [Omnitrophica WOR_2 bacterium]
MKYQNNLKGRKVVYFVPGMNGMQVKRNITYKTAGEQALLFDVYAPPDLEPGSLRPAVIFIHEDGPEEQIKNAKDWEKYVSWGKLTAAYGFTGITFNHRASYNQIMSLYAVSADIDDLIQYLNQHACELGVDPEALCLWSCSSGVPYLAPYFSEPKANIRCLVAYYGIMNLEPMSKELPEFMPLDERKEQIQALKKYSLIRGLDYHPEKAPPTLVVQADLDHPDIIDGINQFYRKAKEVMAPVGLIGHPEGRHAFDVLDESERSKEIVRATMEFIKEHLSRKESID